jgi:MFS family permease
MDSIAPRSEPGHLPRSSWPKDLPDMSFRRSQVAVAALFCFLGFHYGTWVSRVPYLQTHLDLSVAEVGLLLLGPGIGATVSFPLVARLMRQPGSRMLCIVSAFALLVILLALSAAPDNLAVVVVLLFLDGVALACLNVAMNAQGAALESRFARNTMARLHAVYSGGMFAAALLASAVATFDSGLPVHFLIAGLLLLGLLTVSWTGLLPREDPAGAAAETVERTGRGWALPSMVVLGLGVAMIFSELTEGAMNDWSALYLRDVTHATAEVAPLGIATFSATMALARLFADSWRARWGDRRVVLTGTALAAAGMTGALLAGGWLPALIGFAAVGLGMAAVVPCLFVAAAGHGDNALALVATAGTAGLLAGPPIIGLVAHISGLAWGMTVVAGAIALVFISVTRIRLGAGKPADETASARATTEVVGESPFDDVVGR